MTRSVHPGAWWAWALLLATAATRTTNPLLLGLLLGVAAFVVSGRRTPHGGRAFGFFVRLGLLVLVMRLAFETVFGDSLPGHVLFRLPSVPLPSALAGLRIGGPVTAESLVSAGYGGLQLATLLICLGAEDPWVPPEHRQKFEADLKGKGVSWQINLYGSQTHSFTNPRSNLMNNPEAARYDGYTNQDSWLAMLRLFSDVFQ